MLRLMLLWINCLEKFTVFVISNLRYTVLNTRVLQGVCLEKSFLYFMLRLVLCSLDTLEVNELRSVFMENLLRIYQKMESSFMKEIYGLYKAFSFRTLWETENPLPQFQRVASEKGLGGRLNGIMELTNVLRNIQNMENRAVKCFTNNIYTTDIQKWSFSQQTDSKVLVQFGTEIILN